MRDVYKSLRAGLAVLSAAACFAAFPGSADAAQEAAVIQEMQEVQAAPVSQAASIPRRFRRPRRLSWVPERLPGPPPTV